MARRRNKPAAPEPPKTATIALPGGLTATVSEEWAKRWPEDVAGRPSDDNAQED